MKQILGPVLAVGHSVTEVEGSHVIMISRPDVVADVIKTAAAAVSRPVDAPRV